VQTIYLDPPYGIKFGSNWQVSTRKRDVKDGKAEDATRQPEQVRAFRDTWKLGIHSYLAYLRDRLVVARDLLTETGSVFVQIGDENVHLVRCLMDEVYGSENFCAHIIYVTTSTQGSDLIPTVNDNLLWFARNRSSVKYRGLFETKAIAGFGSSGYNFVELANGTERRATSDEIDGRSAIPANAKFYAASDLTSSHYSLSEPIAVGGKIFESGHRYWSTSTAGMTGLGNAKRLLVVGNSLRFKRYFDDFPVFARSNVWTDTGVAGFTSDKKTYVIQTNQKVVERCLLMTTDPGDLVLDPTCGSGTTANVAEQWGRRWITCDTSRVALALARTRLMAARYPYYLLADSPDGIKREMELTGKIRSEYRTEEDIRKGFVYKRVPHVTLKSIANNPDIRKGMSRQQIDAAISRNADTETLYDQPYEDKKRVRVCGPFSVESLSPHRVLSTADENQDGTVTEREAQKEQDFVTMILDNLKKAGVQNTRKEERLNFDQLAPLCWNVVARDGRIHRLQGEDPARGHLHRTRTWDRRPAAGEGSRKRSGPRRRLRRACRLRVRL
jgi:adenine-specific DNA-methyltransferase